MTPLDDYLSKQGDRFERELCELLRIASVSADSKHRDDVHQAANWVADQFRAMKLNVELVPTAGHPIVYAESPPVAGAPVALVYGHYDVQPPDPLDEWKSPPFEPTVRDGNLYARGATDDKGQMFTHLKSTQAWIDTAGKLPLQLKFVIEGEEEVGSAHLDTFIADNRQRLACDVVVISDTCQFGPGQPAITYGLRGIAYYELRLSGPKQDLHSGTFGGAVANPANVLVNMLAELVNDRGEIQVPGFYDDVQPLTPREREQFAALPFDEAAFMHRSASTRSAVRRATRRSNAAGHGPPATSTACGADTRAKEPRRCCPPGQAQVQLPTGAAPGPEKDFRCARKVVARIVPPGHQAGADRLSRRAGRSGTAG